MFAIKTESPPPFLNIHDLQKQRKILLIIGAFIGAALLSVLLVEETIDIIGASHTSLSLRPNYELSTFVYKRGWTDWLMLAGVTTTGVSGAIALFTGVTCTVGQGVPFLGQAGCILGLVALAGCAMMITSAAGSAIQNQIQENKEHESVGKQEALVVGYFPGVPSPTSTRPTPTPGNSRAMRESADKEGSSLDPSDWRRTFFGDDYRFHGHITKDDTFNGHLTNRNGGADVPVWAFTTPDGLRLHHVMIYNKTEGTIFHRLGYMPPKISQRQVIANTSAYFSSGGMDALDCTNSSRPSSAAFTQADYNQVGRMINCTVPNWMNSSMISLQFMAKSDYSTLGAGRIAPVFANGSSLLTSPTYNNSCPSFAPNPSPSCGYGSTQN